MRTVGKGMRERLRLECSSYGRRLAPNTMEHLCGVSNLGLNVCVEPQQHNVILIS